jgi:hypothetical protein
MKKKEWNEGLNYLDPDLVEKHIEQKERLRQKKQKNKAVWLRFGAIATCFVLILSAVIAVPMLQKANLPDVPMFSSCSINENTSNEISKISEYSSDDADLSNEENISPPMFFRFYSSDEFQTWVNNGGDNYSGSQYVLNVIKEEKGIILPCLKNSKYNFKRGKINFNVEESKILLTLTFEGENTEKYTEKYQAVNVLYIYIRAIDKSDRHLDIKNYVKSLNFKYSTFDDWYSSISSTVKGRTLNYIYHDCNPSKDSEDILSYAHIIIDNKWMVTIVQENGLQMKPFDHEILNWLDFETITYNDLSIDIKNDE